MRRNLIGKRAGVFWVLACSILAAACDRQTVYKSHQEFKDAQWYADYKPTFDVDIQDVNIRYNVYYLLRSAIQYPYYNLYLTRKLTGPENKILSNDLVELKISDETTGKPFGKGLGDLFDQKILFLKDYTFPASGVYTFEITQSMRQNPLPFVVSIGICVEKAEP
jgi:gliding motility-associated lipoprotein GldH